MYSWWIEKCLQLAQPVEQVTANYWLRWGCYVHKAVEKALRIRRIYTSVMGYLWTKNNVGTIGRPCPVLQLNAGSVYGGWLPLTHTAGRACAEALFAWCWVKKKKSKSNVLNNLELLHWESMIHLVCHDNKKDKHTAKRQERQHCNLEQIGKQIMVHLSETRCTGVSEAFLFINNWVSPQSFCMRLHFCMKLRRKLYQ